MSEFMKLQRKQIGSHSSIFSTPDSSPTTPHVSPAPTIAHNFSQVSVLPKLEVSQPHDPAEQEADRVAEQIMRMPEPINTDQMVMRSLHETIHRKCAACEDEDEVQAKLVDNVVQKKPTAMRSSGEDLQADSTVESRLSSSKGGGSPLPDEVRSFMEPRFKADFSGVRVHTDGAAVQMNRELGAQAFTYGSDIYYGGGKAPGKNDLMAHELTHVVQQTTVSKQVQRLCGVDESCPEEMTDPSAQSSSADMTSTDAPMSVQSPEGSNASFPPQVESPSSADMTSTDAPMSVQSPEGPNASFPPQVESPSSADMTSTDESTSVLVASGLPVRDLQPPGNCIQGIHDGMQREVKAWCDHPSGRACTPADSCPRLLQKIRRNERCAFFRRQINNRCYDGGDLGHRIAERDARAAQANCMAIYNSKCRQSEPVPEPVPQPERQPEQRFDQSFLDRMAQITGLTGAALITYLIISEGSRLFPPRNLIPVP